MRPASYAIFVSALAQRRFPAWRQHAWNVRTKGVAGLEAEEHADEPPKTHAGGIFDDWDWHTVKW